MKPIAGSVVSSKPVSLSKAATILSRFLVADTGAHQDVSAFPRHTSEAFDELVEFHRDLGPCREDKINDEVQSTRKKDRKKKRMMKEAEAVELALERDFAETEGNPETSVGGHWGGALGPEESKSIIRDKEGVGEDVEGGGGVVVVEMET